MTTPNVTERREPPTAVRSSELLADFFAWVNGKAASGTTVTINGWPNMGSPAVEIWAADDGLIGKGETLLAAIQDALRSQSANEKAEAKTR